MNKNIFFSNKCLIKPRKRSPQSGVINKPWADPEQLVRWPESILKKLHIHKLPYRNRMLGHADRVNLLGAAFQKNQALLFLTLFLIFTDYLDQSIPPRPQHSFPFNVLSITSFEAFQKETGKNNGPVVRTWAVHREVQTHRWSWGRIYPSRPQQRAHAVQENKAFPSNLCWW